MDIHPPDHPIRSVKDFLFHLLTITIGILIALSFEGLLEWHHHRALAREARANLASEIRGNEQTLEKGLTSGPDAEQRLQATIKAIDAYRKSHQQPQSLNWGFGIFALSDTAWQSAANTGAIGYMNYSEVQRYERVYVLQEQFLSIQERTLEKWLDLQKWSSRINSTASLANLDVQDLSAIEGAASAALVHTQTEESIAHSLIDQYKKALQ